MMIRTWIFVLLVCWVFLMWLAIRADAAEGHSTYHSWYKGQMMKAYPEVSCCDDKDCRPAKWRQNSKTGNIEFFVENKWIAPPQKMVQQKMTPDGGAHACLIRDREIGGDYILWYCAIIPFQGF